jgi:hypothetical protein
MTQLHEPLTIFKLHKILPKKMSHIKEEAKVKFINAVVESYRINENFGTINFDASTYNGKTVTIVYNPSNIKLPIHKVVEQVMSQWYFSNLEKNENVYFYRFINIHCFPYASRLFCYHGEWYLQLHYVEKQCSSFVFVSSY